ncbi:hypothetical protein [Pseudomonas putida]|uniref:hypothetical protein n=1 Tax=Pseudomonas putida TaxID=303 RepID=UPI000E032780|nr:hypothetical protein [Pseudomonas putida]SUD78513.1 Uncharacterised protein [Pseudomonas putida]
MGELQLLESSRIDRSVMNTSGLLPFQAGAVGLSGRLGISGEALDYSFQIMRGGAAEN